MTYRFPIVVGDRVATAPHTDLFMRGLRFGVVIDTKRLDAVYGAQRFLLRSETTGLEVWFGAEDLLGAINPVPGQYAEQTGATPSTGRK